MNKSKLYIPLGIEKFVIAAFKISESKSLLYKRCKTIERLQNDIAQAVQMNADYISIRIIKEKENV